MKWCSRCGAGGELRPLAGTNCDFCASCSPVIADLAAYLEHRGEPLESVLASISQRFLNLRKHLETC